MLVISHFGFEGWIWDLTAFAYLLLQLVIVFYFRFWGCCLASQGSSAATQHIVSVESSSLILHCTFRDLFSVMIHLLDRDSPLGIHRVDRTTNLMF